MNDFSLVTNAPHYWPKIYLNPERLRPMPADLAAATFHRTIQRSFSGLSSFSVSEQCCTGYITPEGLLHVDVFVKVEDTPYHLFFIPEGEGKEERAGIFKEAELLASRYGTPEPFYYSIAPVSFPEEEPSHLDASSLHAEPTDSVPSKGVYATWWSGDRHTPFSSDPAFKLFDAYQKALAGHHHEFITDIATSLGSDAPDIDSEMIYPVFLPEGHEAVIKYEPERGVLPLFRLRETSIDFRNRYLLYFLYYAQKWVAEKGYDPSPAAPAWWKEIAKEADSMLSFGEVVL